jgi:hypothetical protein
MEPLNDDEVIPQFEQPAIADDNLLGVRHCLMVCRLETPPQQDMIIDEGFTEVRLFVELRDKDIHERSNQSMLRLRPLEEDDRQIRHL